MGKKSEVDIYTEIGIIIESLREISPRSKELINEFKKMQESAERVDRLEGQVRLWDSVLEKFVPFDREVDLMGERVKLISKSLKRKSKKDKAPIAVEKLMKKDSWVFDW